MLFLISKHQESETLKLTFHRQEIVGCQATFLLCDLEGFLLVVLSHLVSPGGLWFFISLASVSDKIEM